MALHSAEASLVHDKATVEPLDRAKQAERLSRDLLAEAHWTFAQARSMENHIPFPRGSASSCFAPKKSGDDDKAIVEFRVTVDPEDL